ncbi:MFS transporter [Halobacillus salinarum]|uniref:MFS transporter n=1 Tax=Halobacillus salinarum TaxID=2932257 RepID=A0ABY4EL85_9BACI|nr:MFS transporter [Halobacillus salinarum]UOQ45232.1 MFS transporter [Halobacillus salinarum]
MNKQPLWTKSFVNVCMSNFFVFLVFYLLFVTLPIYTIDQLHVKEGQAGLIITIFLFAAIVIRPFAGHWVDTVGRRPVLIMALVIFFSSSVLYLTTQSFPLLLIIRFIQGLGFGMATTVIGALAADVVPKERRGEGMGYFAMSMNFAMVIGPFLGLTIIHSFTYSSMFTISALFAAIAFIAGMMIQIPKRTGGADLAKSSLMPAVQGLLEKPVIPIAFTGALMAVAYAGVLSFVSVYAKQNGLEEASTYFFVVYAVVLLLSRPFTGKWFDRYGENVIVIPSILSFSAGLLILSMADTPGLLLTAGGLIGIGWGTIVPSFQTIALKKAPERAGSATATFFSIFDTGIGLGSYVVGALATNIGFSSLYFNSSFIVLAVVLVYMGMHGRQSQLQRKYKWQHTR